MQNSMLKMLQLWSYATIPINLQHQIHFYFDTFIRLRAFFEQFLWSNVTKCKIFVYTECKPIRRFLLHFIWVFSTNLLLGRIFAWAKCLRMDKTCSQLEFGNVFSLWGKNAVEYFYTLTLSIVLINVHIVLKWLKMCGQNRYKMKEANKSIVMWW